MLSLPVPTGTVTFVFTDIEGSTRLWEAYPDAMKAALARHDTILRACIERYDGYVFKTIGDAFCAAFTTATEALNAVLAAQLGLKNEPWPEQISIKVRMALHTGAVESRDNDYFGQPLNRAARLLSTGYGGQTILSQVTYDLGRDSLPLQTTLQDLGEHRLKDLARPEHIFQLLHPDLPCAFPALKSLDSIALPNNLPQQVTSFIGREKELAEVQGLLSKTRLLTLTGTGGSGKSRLSLQAAAELLEQFPDGVYLVELAPLADPSLVAQTVANVLGVKEETGKPLLKTLTEHLRTKNLLLLLDNCEHVLDASATVSDALIRSCPGVKILATSREGLGIAGETAYRIPSLSLPDPKQVQTAESLSHFEAVQLFIARAVQAQPSFAVSNANAPALASICFRLDGIPLAIELAAARARSLSVEDINGNFDQRFRLLTGGSRTALPRQQTLRSLIDWSYDLLSPAEKALLCRLSVFAGGWDLESAEAVCAGDDVEEWEILDLLTSMCDKSLAVAEPSGTTTRYRLLETVRQYARDRLLESGTGEAFRDTHLAYFIAQAQSLNPAVHSPRMRETLDRMEEDLDNYRAGLEWSGESPERAAPGLCLALEVTKFMRARGYFTERRDQLSRALEAAGEVSPSLRARGLFALGYYTLTFLDFETAQRTLGESLAIRQALGERHGIAEALDALGHLALMQEDYAPARQLSEECLRLQHALGNQEGIASALGNLGAIAYDEGDLAASRSFWEESLPIRHTVGNPFPIYVAYLCLGEIDLDEKDYRAAEATLRDCLAIAMEHMLKGCIPWALNALAAVFAVTDTPANAARLWGAGERLYEEGSETIGVRRRKRIDAQIAGTRAALGDDAAFDAAWQEGRTMTLDQAVALAQQGSGQALPADFQPQTDPPLITARSDPGRYL